MSWSRQKRNGGMNQRRLRDFKQIIVTGIRTAANSNTNATQQRVENKSHMQKHMPRKLESVKYCLESQQVPVKKSFAQYDRHSMKRPTQRRFERQAPPYE